MRDRTCDGTISIGHHIMYNDELLLVQRQKSEQALFLMRELLPLVTPIAHYTGWTEHERWVLGMLLTSCARSTESALLLCAYGQLWDAEVVLRSVAEGTLKSCFILQSQEKFKERIQEYSVDHFNVSLIKDDKKIRDLLEIVGDSEPSKWRPLTDRLLSDHELERLITKYDRKMRRSIESKWGVAGILHSFRHDNDPHTKKFPGLLHNYSLASHIHHADYIGVSIPDERERRDLARRDAIHLAHLSRLISDCFSYFLLRADAGYTYIKADPTPIFGALAKIDAINKAQDEIYEEWMNIEYGIPNQDV